MKTLIKFLTIPLLLFILSFLLPQKVHLEHQLLINAPASFVFENVTNLQNWEKWSGVLPEIDELGITFQQNEVGIQTSCDWESPENSGQRRQLMITRSVPSKLVALSFDFMKDRKASSLFRFEEKNQSTLITWDFETDLGKNPFYRVSGLMFERILGPDFEKDLEKLKVLCENELR